MGPKNAKELVRRNQTSLGGKQNTNSTDKKLFLTDEALFPGLSNPVQ